MVVVVKARAARAAAASRASHVIKAASAATTTVTSTSAGRSRCQQRLTPRFGGHYGLWRPLRLPTATTNTADYLDEESELESTEAASGQRPQAPKQQQEVCLTTTTAASGVGLRGCSSLCRSLRPLPTL